MKFYGKTMILTAAAIASVALIACGTTVAADGQKANAPAVKPMPMKSAAPGMKGGCEHGGKGGMKGGCEHGGKGGMKGGCEHGKKAAPAAAPKAEPVKK